MNARESTFIEYLYHEIAKHEELLESAYENSNEKHICNNRLIIEKLTEVKQEFENTFF